MASFDLNGKVYHSPAEPQQDIQEYLPQQLSDARRAVGVQQRVDNTKIGRYVSNSWWSMGFGWARARRDPERPRGIGGFRMGTVDTRFAPYIELAILEEAETTSGVDHLRGYQNFSGDMWAFFEDEFAGTGANVCQSRKYGATLPHDFTGGGDIDVSVTGTAPVGGFRLFHSTIHKGRMYIAMNGGSATWNNGNDAEIYRIMYSTDGVTWTDGTGTNWPGTVGTHEYITLAVSQRDNFDDDHHAKVLSFGDNLLYAYYEDPASDNGSVSQIHIINSTDNAATWTSTDIATIPSGKGPMAFLLWYNRDGDVVPILVTIENVYWIDIANTTFEALLPFGLLTGDDNDGRGSTVAADGNLYISRGSGDILQFSLGASTANGERTIVIRNIGPHSKALYQDSDGLPAEFQGHANVLLGSDPRWMFVAYGGHEASRNASIFCFDYETGAWHPFYHHGTANVDITHMILSSEDDSITRLHIALKGSTESTLQMYEQPLVSSITGITKKFQSTGEIEWAEEDFGDPHSSANVLRSLMEAENLDTGATGESIVEEYRVDASWGDWSASGSFTSLGTFLSGTVTLEYGTSSRGVAAKTILRRHTYNRSATNTKTPKAKESELQAYNKLAVLRGFHLPIDVGLTAQMEGLRVETVIANLRTAIASVTLLPLIIGELAEFEVSVENYPSWLTTMPNESSIAMSAERGGTVVLSVETKL